MELGKAQFSCFGVSWGDLSLSQFGLKDLEKLLSEVDSGGELCHSAFSSCGLRNREGGKEVKFTPKQTAHWMAERLAALGLNQEELAEKAGVTAADVSRYKNHKQRPRIDQVEKLAAAFEVNVMDMLIGLGAIDPDADTTPKIAKGERLSSVKWQKSR